MPDQYRTEHIAESPSGWKVRTVTRGTHLVRLAFPPGARKKGAGKLIEVLHPRNENPCVMHGVTRHQSPVTSHNPGDGTEAATDLYREFHGVEPRGVVTMQESDVARKTYTALGDLGLLIIDAPAGTVTLEFSGGDAVKVASSPNGRQLYLIGGNQNIDGSLTAFGSDASKDFVELGRAVQIEYDARKSIDQFKRVRYFHKLGEETGEPPVAFYNRLQRRIYLVGGRYTVEAPGIIN